MDENAKLDSNSEKRLHSFWGQISAPMPNISFDTSANKDEIKIGEIDSFSFRAVIERDQGRLKKITMYTLDKKSYANGKNDVKILNKREFLFQDVGGRCFPVMGTATPSLSKNGKIKMYPERVIYDFKSCQAGNEDLCGKSRTQRMIFKSLIKELPDPDSRPKGPGTKFQGVGVSQ